MIQEFQKQRRRAHVRQNRVPHGNFIAPVRLHRHDFTIVNENLVDARVELNRAAMFFQSANQGVSNGPGAADGNPEPGSCRQQGQHQTQPGAGQILGA